MRKYSWLAVLILSLPLSVFADTTTLYSNSGTLASGEQDCIFAFGFAASASGSLKAGGADVDGKLTIWDETAGVRLGKVQGTSPFFIDTVYTISGDNAFVSSCLTNQSGGSATFQHSFVVTTH